MGDNQNNESSSSYWRLNLTKDNSITEGFFMGVGVNLIGAGIIFCSLLFGLDVIAFIPFVFIGVTQCLWMVPLILYARRNRKMERIKGLIIVIALTILINGSCGLYFVKYY